MAPAKMMARLPSVAIALVASSHLLQLGAAFALPRPTKVVEYQEFNVLPWPLETAAPEGAEAVLRRQLNTVCGYIGGDPGLPATCSAGSHCAVDVDRGVIGCCPDGGSCTQGIFTDCVDSNSGPQQESNPFVYTCQGSDLCYKNNFEGGYSQYGCGTASDLATDVFATASGKEAISITSLPSTETRTSKKESKSASTKTSSRTRSTRSSSKTSSEASSATSDSTSESASKTESASETTSESASETSASTSETSASTTISTQTETDSSSTSTDSNAAASDTNAAAPGTDGDDNGAPNTGAIIGGTISGVAALAAIIVLAIWLWRRRRGRDADNTPLKEKIHAPTPSPEEEPLSPSAPLSKFGVAQPIPVMQRSITPVHAYEDDPRNDPRTDSRTDSSQHNYSYPFSSPGLSNDQSIYNDEAPLTQYSRETRELDDFPHGFNSGLGRIEENDLGNRQLDSRQLDSPSSVYPGPRKSGGGPLWQQNRGDWV